MGKSLMLDIGAGTLDILYYDDESGLHYKAVVKSPVLTVAEKARRLPGTFLCAGLRWGAVLFRKSWSHGLRNFRFS